MKRLLAFLLLSACACVAQGLPLGSKPISAGGGGGGTIVPTTIGAAQCSSCLTNTGITSVSVAAGDTIFYVAVTPAADTITLSDNSGVGSASWVATDSCQNVASGGYHGCVFRKQFASAASGFTLTATSSATADWFTVAAFKATNVSASPYISAGAATPLASATTISITPAPASAGTLIVSYCAGPQSNIAQQSPQTSFHSGAGTGDAFGYYVDPSAGAVTLNCTQSPAGAMDYVYWLYK